MSKNAPRGLGERGLTGSDGAMSRACALAPTGQRDSLLGMKPFLVLLALCLPLPLAAHEFWIEPQAYRIAPDEPLVADIRVGEEFSGSTYSYSPRNFRRFDLVLNGDVQPVPGRAGDRPAVTMAVPQEGLGVIVHETGNLFLTYAKMDKFENFLRHKDWLPLLAEHRARGLPEEKFRERYIRYGKSLVAIGAGQGADADMGLETEIVALANPYTQTLTEMPVQVLYQGAPRADAQVELFEKAPDGSVEVTLHRTDAEGQVRLPVRPGHAYLVDAVVIRALDGLEGDRPPVWESLWASLTFAVP